MKTITSILLLILFNQIYGQIGNDSIVNKSKFISLYLISDSCNKLSDWHEKKSCSQKRIVKQLNKKIFENDLGIVEKLSPNTYRIYFTFVIDENGVISDFDIKTDNKVLKNELLKITDLGSIFSDFRLINELGNINKGSFLFPFNIIIN
ncbi:MAG: hypothetical protein ACOVSR_07730 [Bacteroidia bacterium]|jgi:hypothetical protein